MSCFYRPNGMLPPVVARVYFDLDSIVFAQYMIERLYVHRYLLSLI
jgi:hypothetical protein